MPQVKQSHRALYVDKSKESRQAIEYLDFLGVEFVVVPIRDIAKDPRAFRKLPTLTYVTRGGHFVTRQGLAEIKAAETAILSNYEMEVRVREMEERGELPDWDPVDIAQARILMKAARRDLRGKSRDRRSLSHA